jgi:hypothetical protein
MRYSLCYPTLVIHQPLQPYINSSTTLFRVQRHFEYNSISSTTVFRVLHHFEYYIILSTTSFRIQHYFEYNVILSTTSFYQLRVLSEKLGDDDPEQTKTTRNTENNIG